MGDLTKHYFYWSWGGKNEWPRSTDKSRRL